MAERFLSDVEVTGDAKFDGPVHLNSNVLDKNGNQASNEKKYLAPDPAGTGVVWTNAQLPSVSVYAGGSAYSGDDIVFASDDHLYRARSKGALPDPANQANPKDWTDLGDLTTYLGLPPGALNLQGAQGIGITGASIDPATGNLILTRTDPQQAQTLVSSRRVSSAMSSTSQWETGRLAPRVLSTLRPSRLGPRISRSPEPRAVLFRLDGFWQATLPTLLT